MDVGLLVEFAQEAAQIGRGLLCADAQALDGATARMRQSDLSVLNDPTRIGAAAVNAENHLQWPGSLEEDVFPLSIIILQRIFDLLCSESEAGDKLPAADDGAIRPKETLRMRSRTAADRTLRTNVGTGLEQMVFPMVQILMLKISR